MIVNRKKPKLEALVDISIVIVGLLFVYALSKRYFFTASLPANGEIAVGSKIDLPGVNWGGYRATIVLALQTGCHFCTESAPFYQNLGERARERAVRIVIVMPESTFEAHNYLQSLGINISDVRQAELSSLNISNTPTLILLDTSGMVTRTWVGRLSPERESEVFKSL